MELVPLIQTVAAVFAWMLLCYAVPREFMRQSIAQDYRKYVTTRAYWGRRYDKWIVGSRVFYTDEFWGDIFSALLVGVGVNFGYLILLSQITSPNVDPHIFLAFIVSLPILLFILRLYDRCQLADEEIARRHAIDPNFNPDAEMERILSEDQMHIRRIIGKHAKTGPRNGE